ncbi:hypothetical protein ABIG06_006397 [Bradyrhizobium sp. USDA 326]
MVALRGMDPATRSCENNPCTVAKPLCHNTFLEAQEQVTRPGKTSAFGELRKLV